MKINLHLGWTLAALGAAILLGGCTSMKTAEAARPSNGNFEFKVVEMSGIRELTAPETMQLRALVANFLQKEGLQKSGSYFVRLDFPPETPEGAPAYMIVQLTTFPTPTSYTLLASYSGLSSQYYQPYDMRYNGVGYSGYGYYDPFYYSSGNSYRPRPESPAPHHQPPPNVVHRRPSEPNNPNNPSNHKPTVPRVAHDGDRPDHPRHPAPSAPRANFTPRGDRTPVPSQPERVARTHAPGGEGRHSYTPPAPREHAGGASSSPSPPPVHSTGSERAASSARDSDNSTSQRQPD